MARNLTNRLVRNLLSDENTKYYLEENWDGSIATSALKLWLIERFRREGLSFCCHFKELNSDLRKTRDKLVREGVLFEIEYLLDLVGFEEGRVNPNFGAEIEWSYAKARYEDERDRILNHLGTDVGSNVEQKDIEFYYDFSKLIVVRLRSGVFIGGSYYYDESIEKWIEGFESVLKSSNVSDMKEIVVLFILNTPYKNEQKIVSFYWEPSQGTELKREIEEVIYSRSP